MHQLNERFGDPAVVDGLVGEHLGELDREALGERRQPVEPGVVISRGGSVGQRFR